VVAGGGMIGRFDVVKQGDRDGTQAERSAVSESEHS
jgi:hypothetical protein